jgi:L-threonylcarbamoyladenylate synthase
MMIYRPGAVTAAQIQFIAGAVEMYRDDGVLQATPRAAMPSPGVGLRHYAPRARLVLIEDELAALAARLAGAAEDLPEDQVGVMLPAELTAPAGAAVFPWGSWAAPEQMARTLYAGLRALDGKGCTVILCPLPPAAGIGAAIRDRLLRAGNRE